MFQARKHLQDLNKIFLSLISTDSVIDQAKDFGILSFPTSDDWEERTLFSHVVPIRTQPKRAFWLCFHLIERGLSAMPMEFPTVPKGQDRIRLTFHATNTVAEVEELVHAISEWAQEMIEIDRGTTADRIPKAARRVYASLANGTDHS